MSANLGALIPELQPFAKALIQVCSDYGLMPTVTSTLRSLREQVFLYERYIQGKSQYPAAKPGTSAHEFGWAFDMTVQPMAALPDVGRLWESWGGVWGGHYSDPVHFEFPGFQAPAPAYADEYWRRFAKAADYASFVVTPLATGEGRSGSGGYSDVAAAVEQFFGF